MDSSLQSRRSSTASVTIHLVDDQNSMPPRWGLVNGQRIDDLTDVTVSEDVASNTLITGLRLMATSVQGRVQYHLSNNGPPELNGNGAFKIPSPSPLNDSSLMPIATTSFNIDASLVSSYVLRCRAFVSNFLFLLSVPVQVTASKPPSKRPIMCQVDVKLYSLSHFWSNTKIQTLIRVTTCLENLEMSGNLKHVREMSGMLLTVREMSGKNLVMEKCPKTLHY